MSNTSRTLCRRLHACSKLPKEAQSTTRKIGQGLNEKHRIQVEGGIPPLTYEQQRDKITLGQHFGRYGFASGVDVRQLWPTVEEIQEVQDLKLYRKASDAMALSEKLAEEKAKWKADYVSKIEKNLKNYDKTLADYEKSFEVHEEKKTDAELATERRIQEIQEYFGYWIDPNDPRFDVMLKQKEAEELKAEKQAKKDEKRKRTVAATS